jgi:hypothetical protein
VTSDGRGSVAYPTVVVSLLTTDTPVGSSASAPASPAQCSVLRPSNGGLAADGRVVPSPTAQSVLLALGDIGR